MPPDMACNAGSGPEFIEELSRYPHVVSTIPIPGLPNVRVLGAGTEGTIATQKELDSLRNDFAAD